MIEPYIIGISGESGVGKSTIAEIVTLYFGEKNTTVISTDDLHKWERNNKNWYNFTHLNPDANNLELGDFHILDLAAGKSIYRSRYNHTTGYFDPPTKIEPQEVIVIEGLHAFYSDISKQLTNLKIFIDTDEELRTHWKIIRDTEERGYKYNIVLDTINKRKIDNDKIRLAQISVADVIIKIFPKNKIISLGDKNEKIDLDLSISFKTQPVHSNLFSFIKTYITELDEFVKMAEILGNDLDMCQNGGGNISTKISSDYMMIKSSGFDMKDIYKSNGYSVVDYNKILGAFDKNDDVFENILHNSIALSKYKRPSMETGFHVLLDKYVIHTHPIYLTLLLCLDDSRNILSKLYNKFSYQYIDYVSPGYALAKRVESLYKSEIYFLENHGAIVSTNSSTVGLRLIYDINNIAKEYIENHCDFQPFDLSFADLKIDKHYLFPDFVIFSDNSEKKEIISANNYIDIIGSKLGKLRSLTSDDVQYLKHLEAEKYRKEL